MIHEALFYLLNMGSSDEEKYDEWINSSEMQKFLHPGERKILQRIANVAVKYHKIQKFIKSVTEPESGTEKSAVSNPGLYLVAFCDGLNNVTESYREEILKLEDAILKNPHLPLTYFLTYMEKYENIFNNLLSTINANTENNVHGCLILGNLLNNFSCGSLSVVEATNQIVQSVNVVFYRHLCNWIIYGDLLDIHEEFFICDAKSPDENFLPPENKKTKIKKPAIVQKFYLRKEMLPGHIPLTLGEIILFVGRIVWIVNNGPEINSAEKYQIKLKRDVWEGASMEYYEMIKSLESNLFSFCEFQRSIEECRYKLTKYLWTLMLEEANLLEHLQLIRDYYALGRGELFQHFIITAEDHLKNTSSDNYVHALNSILIETARKMYGENDKSYTKFEIAYSATSSSFSSSSSKTWTNIELNFDVEWPLHIIFHPNALNLYNKLFSFLLRLKKTQIDLDKLWLNYKNRNRPVDHRILTLRRNLSFIVHNLLYYLEVDVIEAQFSIFLRAVKSANEFEDIIKVHTQFLTHLLTKTFVMELDNDFKNHSKHDLYQLPALDYQKTSKIYKIIINVLELCDKFCFVANSWGGTLSEPSLSEFEGFKRESNMLIETLLQLLHYLHKHSSGEHLLQLLHQLDFNCWFSKNTSEFSLTVS